MKPLLIVIPIAIIGSIVGAGMTGVIDIPGLTPAKKAAKQNKKEPPKASASPAPTLDAERSAPADNTPRSVAKVLSDPQLGNRRLAKLWNEIDTGRLIPILGDWKDRDLALVLAKMDPAKTAEVLAALKPARASKLSRELLRLASLVPPTKELPVRVR